MYCRYHSEYHHGSMRKILCKAHREHMGREENPKPWRKFVEAYIERTDPKIRKLVLRLKQIFEAAKEAEEVNRKWEKHRIESTVSSVTKTTAPKPSTSQNWKA